MSVEKYLVEVDFESPLLSNSEYGVNLGVMRLITGDVAESHAVAPAVPGVYDYSFIGDGASGYIRRDFEEVAIGGFA